MRKHALLIVLGLLVVLLFAGNAIRFYQLSFVSSVEKKLYDTRLRLTMPQTLDDDIVILDIDEKSLKAEGHWPWGRDKLALLLDKLFDTYGVAEVGFDVVFAERDNSSGLAVLQGLAQHQLKGVPAYQSALQKIQPQLEYDAQFAKKMLQRNVVLGYYFSNSGSTTGALPAPVFPAGTFTGRPISFIHADGYGGNLDEFQGAAASSGHFTQSPDEDGVVRRIPMLIEYKGAYYESLSMAMVRTLLGNPPLKAVYGNEGSKHAGMEWLELNNVRIPVDRRASALVPYRGFRSSFRYVPVTDVLHGDTPIAELKNKIILVGTTAPGLLDLRTTPVDEVYPGVEVHANMISGILHQDIKSRPPYIMGVEAVLLLLVGGVLSILLPRLSPMHNTVVSFFVLFGVVVLNGVAWKYGAIDFPLASFLLMVTALFALNMSYGYFVESRTKRQITKLFGQYVPKEVVGELSEHPEQVSMAGDSREMTILFSDVRGFTSISEGLDSKELSLLMNEFLTPLSRVVYKHRGTIDKYMGDCIMAFWGAPLPDERHAYHGILAGLEMHKALEALQPRLKKKGWPELHIGVGLNTGRVSVGNMGSEVRVAYTVMGDAVNLASRLEGITKEYGARIIVGENTRAAAPEFVYRELDMVRVKGKEEPVAIFEPLGLQGEVSESVLEEIKLFHQVLRAYRSQDWGEAELLLLSLQKRARDTKLYQVYTERVAYYRSNPPPAEWDGVFVFNTK